MMTLEAKTRGEPAGGISSLWVFLRVFLYAGAALASSWGAALFFPVVPFANVGLLIASSAAIELLLSFRGGCAWRRLVYVGCVVALLVACVLLLGSAAGCKAPGPPR